MSKNDNKDLAAQVAAMTQKAVNDDPHGEKKPAKKKASAKKKATAKVKPRPLTGQAEEVRGREKVTATVSPAAIEAMRSIELFLINDCGLRRMNTSAAVDIALQLAGENLKENKGRIEEIIAGLAETDKRRRSA